MGVLSDSVSSVVAPTYLPCGIFFIGMAITSVEGQFKVAHYPDFRRDVDGVLI